MPRPLLVAVDDVLQDRAFVVGLEIDVLQPSVAAFVDADVVLRPEFDRILDLARTIGRTYGWVTLTIRSATRCFFSSNISFCWA